MKITKDESGVRVNNGGFLKRAERFISNLIPHTHSAERRSAMNAAAEQIDYYKKAKEDLAVTRKANDDQRNSDRKRINEKELRSRQRTFRRAGFMSEPSMEVGDKLGM